MKKINLYFTVLALIAFFVGCDQGGDMAAIKEKQQRAIDSTAAAKMIEVRTNLVNGCNQSISSAIRAKADSILALAATPAAKSNNITTNNKPKPVKNEPKPVTPPTPAPVQPKTPTQKDRPGAIDQSKPMTPAQQKERDGAIKTGGSTTPGSSVAPGSTVTPTQQKQRPGAVKVDEKPK